MLTKYKIIRAFSLAYKIIIFFLINTTKNLVLRLNLLLTKFRNMSSISVNSESMMIVAKGEIIN